MSDRSSEINKQQILVEMLEYISSTLEQPHSVFGGLPICPFARQARLNQQIQFVVYAFSLSEILNSTTPLSEIIHAFSQQQDHDVLVVIHPNSQVFSLLQFYDYLDRLNAQLSRLNLIAFGGHPQDHFEVQGVRTRQDPFINFTVQSRAKLKQASSQLHNTDYYKNWSDENLQAIKLS